MDIETYAARQRQALQQLAVRGYGRIAHPVSGLVTGYRYAGHRVLPLHGDAAQRLAAADALDELFGSVR